MVSSFTWIPIYHFLIACLEQNQGNFPSHLTEIAFVGLDVQGPVFERSTLSVKELSTTTLQGTWTMALWASWSSIKKKKIKVGIESEKSFLE